MRFAITINGNSSVDEQRVDVQTTVPVKTWIHLALVMGPTGATLYLDGVQVGASASVILRPADLGATGKNYIGRSQFSGDPYLDGMIDDFRIYNRALGAGEILVLASGQ